MEVSEIGRQDFKLSQNMMLDFIRDTSDVKLIGSYSYMLNCMYSFSLKILVDKGVKYTEDNTEYTNKDRKKSPDKYSQCEVIGHYLLYKGVQFDRDELSRMIAIRNRLVHEPRFIKSMKIYDSIIYPNYQEMLKISNVFYGSDICGDYLRAITKFCVKKEPKGYVKNPDELPDVINSGLDKTNSKPDLMEQLMNQNKK